MKNTAKRQAIIDMRESGINTAVLYYEHVIIELTKTQDSIRIDLRCLNGGRRVSRRKDKPVMG